MRQFPSLVSAFISFALLGCVTATTTRPLAKPWESRVGKFVHVTMLDSTRYHGTLLGADSTDSILIDRTSSPDLGLRTDSIAHMEYSADDLVKTVLGYAAVFVCLNVIVWMASPSRW